MLVFVTAFVMPPSSSSSPSPSPSSSSTTTATPPSSTSSHHQHHQHHHQHHEHHRCHHNCSCTTHRSKQTQFEVTVSKLATAHLAVPLTVGCSAFCLLRELLLPSLFPASMLSVTVTMLPVTVTIWHHYLDNTVSWAPRPYFFGLGSPFSKRIVRKG